ncbi:succinate dehydrogenase, cytochrome b556 subunit [Gammaproteobacteria bacterium]|nr:succinate dehydrogenase, cytochrome b556 subunit [Gammaproteobacteria bacterium]
MKDKRPVNLDIGTIQLPLAALTSITHRISGIIVFVGIAFLLKLFDKSLSSQEGFNALQIYAQFTIVKFGLWAILSALAYHMVAGIKHLIMEMGVGETKEGSFVGAAITIVISLILIASLGVWIW